MQQTRLPSLMVQDKTASNAQVQSRLPSMGGSEIPFELPEPEKEEVSRDYGWGITTAFKRGFERLRSLPDVAQGDYEELAMHFENMENYDLSENDKQRMQELQNTDGWWDSFAYYVKNPSLIAQVVAESLPMSVAPIAAGVGGGVAGGAAGSAVPAIGTAVGAIAGTVTGAALGSYATEYLNSIADYFGRQGVDMTDPNQLRQAFGDGQIMSDARDFANKRGIPIAIFDGLSFGLAGRIYKPASALVKGSAKPIAGVTAELTLQAGAGMAGEATAQVASVGEIEDIPGVWAEGFGEIVPGVVEVGANRLMAGRAKEVVDDSLARQLDADITEDEEAALLAENGISDKLAWQASRSQEAKDKLQVQQYVEMAETRAAQDAEIALAEAEIEAETRESARIGQAFVENELQREIALERTSREAKYQKELQEGEAAAEIAPFTAPATASEPQVGDLVSAEPMPGTSVGDALRAAGVKSKGEPDVETQSTSTVDSQPVEKFGGGNADVTAVETGFDTKTRGTAVVLEETAEVESAVPPAPIAESETTPRKSEDFTHDTLATETAAQIKQLHKGSTLQQKRSANKAIIVLKKAKYPEADTLRKTYRDAVLREEAPAPAGAESEVMQAALKSSTTVVARGVPVETPAVEDFKDLDTAKDEAATSPTNDLKPPTKAQKEVGNYKKSHRRLAGLDIAIENPVGSTRRGSKIKDHYGYIKRTIGADEDQVDVFINPKAPEEFTGKVWVIDQTTADGVTFDEHKVMLGYKNQMDAVRGYKRNYAKGWKVGPVTEMVMPEFKKWLNTDTTKPIKNPKPSRHARKFARSQKGLRYSIPAAKKSLIQDAKQHVPNADANFVEKVIGAPRSTSDPAVQTLTDYVTTLDGRAGATSKVSALTKTEVEIVIAPLVKKFPSINAQIHESVSAMPDTPARRKMLKKFSKIKVMPVGFYDTLTDEVHMFADRFKTPEAAIRNFLHEGVAHKGLRILFSKTAPSGAVVLDQKAFNNLMDDIYENATNKKRLKELEHKYGTKNQMDTPEERISRMVKNRTDIGEEYIAWMAESGKDVSLLQRVVALIRKLLRKMGIVVQAWTDNDINNLLREVRSAMSKGKPIEDVSMNEEVMIKETGEVFEIETNVGTMLRQHDKRVSVIGKLRDCL